MKFTIEGFSQKYAMTLRESVEVNGKIVEKKIDCTDLVILRWFVDFYPKMKKFEIDGIQYAWVSRNKLVEDLPLIDISVKSFSERMQKLAHFGLLTYKLIKEGGTFSVYGFGENYSKLITDTVGSQTDTVGIQTDTGWEDERTRGGGLNGHGVGSQTDTKDISIKDRSIKNYSIKDITTVIDHLNAVLGTNYKSTTRATQQHIKARLSEGFTVEDLKAVIDKKAAEWKGTKMEKYLRPETLFGSKFESYLNEPINDKKGGATYGTVEQDDAGFDWLDKKFTIG